MESALRGMSQANMDLGILQETKIINGVYTRGSASYKVIATDAPSRHRGGVALFYRLTPRFVVEVVERCGPNLMVWQVVTEEKRWYIVGAYIAPADKGTMETVVKVIRRTSPSPSQCSPPSVPPAPGCPRLGPPPPAAPLLAAFV